MRILFVHQNFPGQYRHLVKAMAAQPENEVAALTMSEPPVMEGVRIVRHGGEAVLQPSPSYLSRFDLQIRRGQSAAAAANGLKQAGFVPDLICAHPGWGEALFLKDVFPSARLICYQEFYYQREGSDVNFDPEFPTVAEEDFQYLRLRNSNALLSLAAADWSVSPTAWQKSQFPVACQSRISIIHEGIDTDTLRPDPAAWVMLNALGRKLTAQDEVITFVSRNLEPYRGFHIFMRTLPELLRRRPNAIVVIVGGDDVSYGHRLPQGQRYREHYLKEVGLKLDEERVRFVGRVPYEVYINLMQISSAHVYLTYPFVLSWSMLEAMSMGAALVASATPPVQEVIGDRVNGLLVDFFSPPQIVEALCEILDDPERMAVMRKNARDTIINTFDLKTVCLPKQIALLHAVAGDLLDEPIQQPSRGFVPARTEPWDSNTYL
jgi:glycosyltransferase involved in cell wall biosynthesis